MSRSLRSLSFLLPCLTAILAPAAGATTMSISGTAFCNISNTDATNTPTPGATHSGTACATFTSSSLYFYTDGQNGTNNLGSFLNSFGVVVGPITYLNGFDASSTLDDSLFEFTGGAYFTQGQTYNAYHDDGTVMNIDGTTVVNAPAPIALTDTQFVYQGPTGYQNFDYVYTENLGTSAFGTDATPTPEPGSLLLLGTGTACLFLVVRRNRRPSFHQLNP